MSATISKCGLFRYTLERHWGWAENGGDVLWVMLNPSTADAETDDPTITRCIGYSKGWGYSGLMVGNLYGYRATDPDALWDAAGNIDVIGSENDQHLCRMATTAEIIIAAWGGHADDKRAAAIARLLSGFGPLYCIGKTKHGQPWHPLYKAKDLRPMPYAHQTRTDDG
jgi:hypothetical protein